MVKLLQRMEVESIYDSFIKKNNLGQNWGVRPRTLPSFDHAVFENWILRESKPLTIFIAEAPLWSYSDELKGPYFYCREYNKNCERDMTRILLDSLDIKGSSKEERLEIFKRKGYLLLDAIKCPVDVECLRDAGMLRPLLRDSGKRILAEELRHLAIREQLRCIVALGGSSRIALKAGIDCKGLPTKGVGDWIQRFDKDKSPVHHAIVTSSVAVPVLPWIFPSQRNGEDAYFARCRLKNAIEEYLESYEQDTKSRRMS